MSGRTWLMMVIVLGINWGGFVAMALYGVAREARRQQGEKGKGGESGVLGVSPLALVRVCYSCCLWELGTGNGSSLAPRERSLGCIQNF